MAIFICSNCGYGSAGWLGRCPNCGQYSSFVERDYDEKGKNQPETKKLKLTSFKEIRTTVKNRLSTGIFEFDRVVGGGFVPGEVLLLSGEPGVGKSTLLLQTLVRLKTVYISGEEAAEQVKDRAQRLGLNLNNFLFSDDLQVEGIIAGLEELTQKTDVLVVDSIQTVYSKSVESSSGNVSQLRESANRLIGFAKKNKVTLVLIGHITKGGDIAGPKTLEHLVDCVLSFEGEKLSNYRILRATKNRFGSTDEIGIFEMKPQGLTQVDNPLIFLANDKQPVAGKAIVGVAEGKRSLFFEIQTLTVPTQLAIPRRVVNGVDFNKVQLLLAVIRKHLHIPLDTYDIYVNVVGGVQIRSTSADLGIISSLLSSVKNMPIPLNTVFIGEVGLLGEIRKNRFEEKVIKEARRLSFKSIYSSTTLKSITELGRFFKIA
ncbi:DNA repair protein RadA [Candidatus Roizmanbacteria bacterium]|nr:DNA repair protein RadA [Candidatus Roizmanbacteria bacterium]